MKVTTDACLFGAWAASKISKSEGRSRRMLDIGTGTGLLSMMMHQVHPDLQIDAVEIDPLAANQANENVEINNLSGKIRIINNNINKLEVTNHYDLIISNPPFYQNELISGHTQKDLAHHSTELLLDEVFHSINMHLAADGTFMLLLPCKRLSEINKLSEENDLCVIEQCLVRESERHGFTRIMLKGKADFNAEATKETSINIRSQPGIYSREFNELLKPFYLYL